MKKIKKIDFGEYVIVAEYDKTNGSLYVTVLDELEGVIETIKVTNKEDDIDDSDETYKMN
jgi:hypothetical protein